jgi:hypothetical protein
MLMPSVSARRQGPADRLAGKHARLGFIAAEIPDREHLSEVIVCLDDVDRRGRFLREQRVVQQRVRVPRWDRTPPPRMPPSFRSDAHGEVLDGVLIEVG